jgi:hypothetical protein
MKIKSTLLVLAIGGALIGIASVFPLWVPVGALLAPCTAIGALSAWLVDNDDRHAQEIRFRKAA